MPSALLTRARLLLPRTALGWLFAIFLVHGLWLRALTCRAVLEKWAPGARPWSWWMVGVGLAVGALQDACVCLATCTSLWLTGGVIFKFRQRRLQGEVAAELTLTSSTSPWHLLPTTLLIATHFVLANAVLCVDLVFLRTRRMRFTWDFVELLWRERATSAWTQLQVDETEWRIACEMAGATLLCSLLLALRLDDRAVWLEPLVEWDRQLWRATVRRAVNKCSHLGRSALPIQNEDDEDETRDDASLLPRADADARGQPSEAKRYCGLAARLARLLMLSLVATMSTLVVVKSAPSLVAMVAWNGSMCEPLRLLTGVQCIYVRPIHIGKKLRELLDATEQSEFVDDAADTLVRKTLGFHGPLAFDVAVKPDEQPNVLIVVVESFRQRDSRTLLHPDQLETFLPRNVSLTPYFDQWVQRGIGFRSMWSSWRTSRSVEQILFGQLPLDSPTDSGTTTGHANVRLSGLPQLFKAKGYDTLFTTGARTDYDGWDVFLPTHGFDQCFHGWDLAEIGLDELGIDWTAGDHVMAYWGVHDDLTFEVLGHLLKTRQRAKLTKKANPWFATHYTISSHGPFDERPDWFFRLRQTDKLPDFSLLYEHFKDSEIQELVKNYAQMRYFSDMAFGSFMGDLERSGVLNDTVVIVVGDHGHSPEKDMAMPEEDQVGAMNVAAALIAEGRLGEHAGTIIDDVAAQYDLLNTIADIVGVPRDGLLQTGVGRSLKRKPTSDHHLVYSHNPALNLAAVQGSSRIEFFSDVPDVVRVFNVEHDPWREHDLTSELSKTRLREIERICDEGRALNAYFTQRWNDQCLLSPFCENVDGVNATTAATYT